LTELDVWHPDRATMMMLEDRAMSFMGLSRLGFAASGEYPPQTLRYGLSGYGHCGQYDRDPHCLFFLA
jgi:hypothetical protein